jgi:NACHT domain
VAVASVAARYLSSRVGGQGASGGRAESGAVACHPFSGADVVFEASARVRAAGGQDVGSLREVSGYYGELDSGRLVVLGEPGAGKTVLALHLLLDLLEHRVDPTAAPGPVPVRVNAAGWDVDNIHFGRWLVQGLTDLGLLAPIARTLIDGGLVLPVVDGLDEMDPQGQPPTRARKAVERLNEAPWRGRPMILTCRSTTYEAVQALRAGGGLDAGLYEATAVTVSPLTPEQISAYIQARRRGEGLHDDDVWAPILNQLKAEPAGPLAGALTTPWMLSLTVDRLRVATPCQAEELAASVDLPTLQSHLFAALIPAAVQGRSTEDKTSYTDAQVHHWLVGLAQHLDTRREQGHDGTNITLVDLWRMAGPRAPRILHTLTAGLVVGLVFGLAVDLVYGLVVGLVFGPLSALMGEGGHTERLVLRTGKPGALRKRLVFGLVGGLGLVFGLGLVSGLVEGLLFGFVVGLGVGATSCRFACGVVLLALHRVFPPRPTSFLDWAYRAGLLRSTGGAYQFRHDTFQRWLTDHPTPPDGPPST